MKQITKKDFIKMHQSGELQLIVGGVFRTKEEVMAMIENVRLKIHEYTKPTSNYGNISDSKDEGFICKIWRSDCEDFIFVEDHIDYSKDRNTSDNSKKVFTTAYLAC